MMRWGVLAVAAGMCFGGCNDDDGGPPRVDAAPLADADPLCAGANSIGGFSDCTVCTAAGTGCDTIDVSGQSSKVCDCTAACPCGLHCGDITIAPGVVVSNVCIR
jgi:hypothetical protein